MVTLLILSKTVVLVFCVVLLCVFTFLVPCVVISGPISAYNNVWFVFASSCLQEDSCLIYVICVCLRIVVSNTYCIVIFCLLILYHIMPVSLDCPFLIAPSVFSNVYLHIPYAKTHNHCGDIPNTKRSIIFVPRQRSKLLVGFILLQQTSTPAYGA